MTNIVILHVRIHGTNETHAVTTTEELNQKRLAAGIQDENLVIYKVGGKLTRGPSTIGWGFRGKKKTVQLSRVFMDVVGKPARVVMIDRDQFNLVPENMIVEMYKTKKKLSRTTKDTIRARARARADARKSFDVIERTTYDLVRTVDGDPIEAVKTGFPTLQAAWAHFGEARAKGEIE